MTGYERRPGAANAFATGKKCLFFGVQRQKQDRIDDLKTLKGKNRVNFTFQSIFLTPRTYTGETLLR